MVFSVDVVVVLDKFVHDLDSYCSICSINELDFKDAPVSKQLLLHWLMAKNKYKKKLNHMIL